MPRFSTFLESDGDQKLRQNMHDVHLEVCSFVKSLLRSLGARKVFVVAVGSSPKETNTAGSDLDCTCHCEAPASNGRYYPYGLGHVARNFRFFSTSGKTFEIEGCTLSFEAEHYERNKSMHLLVLQLHYKKGPIEFQCSVDVTEHKEFTSLHNTLFVRHYTYCDPRVGKLIVSIKRRFAALDLKKIIIGYGWELLTIIALTQLKKVPVVDPVRFQVSPDSFNTLSSTDDTRDFDYAAWVLGDAPWSEFKAQSFTEIEVLLQIKQMLRARTDDKQLVLRFRDIDIQPNIPSAALVLVDPCVPPDSLGSNVVRTLDSSGLKKIRLGLDSIIGVLSQ